MEASPAVAEASPSLALDSSLPLWFKPELFVEPEFSAEAYVSDLKRYVPLETLSSELHSHLGALKNKLVEVINDDYNDFVSLSTKLVNVDGALARMQKPLLDLQERLEAARSSIAGQASELASGLQRRQAVAAARALLELMQDTAHVQSKVDKLLGEVRAAGAVTAATAPEELEAHCRLLDRVASEVSRLQFYAARGQELEFMRQLQPRIDAAAEQLQAELDAALGVTLQSQSPVALGICLHAYAAIARPQAAESVVRDTLVAPVVQKVVAEQKAKSLASPAAGAPLGDILAGVSEGLKAQCAPFLEHTLSQPASSQAFDFLGASVLAAVHAALEESLPGVFSAGVPAHFHSNYRAALRFLEALEAYCTAQAQVEQFRASAAYTAFLKKWNLPVYFSLRFQDIAGGLESKLSAATLQPAAAAAAGGSGSGVPQLRWAPSAAVWAGLQRVASPEVFLPQLADKFVRLALQLLARYAAWISAGMKQRSEAAAAAAAGAGGGQQAAAAAGGGSEPAGAAAAGAGSGQQQQQQQQGDAAGGGGTGGSWEAAATPEQLVALRQDVDALLASLLSSFVPHLSGLVRALGQEAAEAVAASFSEAAEQLEAAGAALMGAVADSLTEKSVVVLKQLRGIVATFRMTNRSQPSRPSHYVSMILAPLHQFLQAEAAGKLSGEARQQLAEAVAAGVSARYLHLADDTLSTVRKTESSLKRLKARQQGGEGAAAPDTDKMIAMQLFLDVQEFGRQAKQAGVDASQLESYQQLWRMVAPEEQADAISF